MMMIMYIPSKSQKLHTNNMEGEGMDKISDEILEVWLRKKVNVVGRDRNSEVIS